MRFLGWDIAQVSTILFGSTAAAIATACGVDVRSHGLEQDYVRRAQLFAELLEHAEQQDAQLNPAGVDIDEPALYVHVPEWAVPEDRAAAAA